MQIINSLKKYSISIFFGFLLLVFATLIFIGFFNHNLNGFAIGSFSSELTSENPIVYHTSYFSGTLLVLFGYSSYLIPVFLMILGIKKIINIKTHFFLLHLIFFIAGINLLSLLSVLFGINNTVVGLFELSFLYANFNEILNNNLYYYVLTALVIVFSIFFTLYGLTINNKIIILILKLFSSFLYFVFKNLKLTFVLSLFQSLRTKSTFKNNLEKNQFKKITNSKKEPGFYKTNEISIEEYSLNKKDISFGGGNKYSLPPLSLLKKTEKTKYDTREQLKINQERARRLENILLEYGVEGKIQKYNTGPLITLFEFVPAPGIKNSKIVGLSDDITRAMSSLSTRISSQPGKSTIGIEIPNDQRFSVFLGDLLNDNNFQNNNKSLTLALGKNISGENIFTDLEKMPHLLIAGTTGSGKSVAINSMILSLLYKFKPSECKFILIDPKMLELSVYEDIPHLLTPVVTNPNKAIFALKWVVNEMENRYRLMSSTGVKNINSFNEKISLVKSKGKKLFREIQTGIDNETRLPIIEKKEIPLEKMPLIVVVIDEMADLMMVAGKEVENLVQRLAQMARASGIHLITATQRPSVDVITGTIKANFPSRISFRVASKFDSRTIINEMGAEQLLGSGDMLFLENGAHLQRLHGGYVSEKEIEDVVSFINSQSSNSDKVDITEEKNLDNNNTFSFMDSKNVDELYEQAVSIVIQQQKVSTSYIQRYLQIGYNRAARIIEKMEKDGIISEANNSGKREVLRK